MEKKKVGIIGATGTVSRECFRRERILISEDSPAKPGKTVHQDFFILKERQSVH